jgi:AcrR family transcriptional regulator
VEQQLPTEDLPPRLRDAKKARTRQTISDIATRMFMARGYDRVTVAEIAAAAEVSVKTVFNYFAAKEELFFDREQASIDALLRVVAERGADASIIDAIAADVQRRWPAFEGQDWRSLDDARLAGRVAFTRTLLESPTLRDHLRRIQERTRDALEGALRAELRARPDDPEPQVAAAMIMAVLNAVADEFARRALRGDGRAAIVAGCRKVARTGFGRLARAYAGDPPLG